MTRFQKKLWTGIGIMALLSPLGLILPEQFKSGGAWGEWSADTIKVMLGQVPQGLKRLSELWQAPLPDYGFGGRHAAPALNYLTYIFSGLLGVALVWLAVIAIKKFLLKHLNDEN